MAINTTSVGGLASELDVRRAGPLEEGESVEILFVGASCQPSPVRPRGWEQRTLRSGSSIALHHSNASTVALLMTSVRPSLYLRVCADSYVGATSPFIL